ncbi:lipocalin family protein [Aquimarina sp. 2304DJ70-9]|uniref:lipocalin family protein n=1 Tax=Aquimarina penaris TaxID=3231044 RepID=UPI0034623E85
MKIYIGFFICFIGLVSCSNDDDTTVVMNTDLIGKWQLIEQLVDPGDGSGTFQPVDSQLTIEFFDNGTVISTNGSLCNMFTVSQDISSGTFSLDNNTINIGCDDDVITIFFEKNGSELILNFICIEACAQKYKKVL